MSDTLKPATDAVTELVEVALQWAAEEPFQQGTRAGTPDMNRTKKGTIALLKAAVAIAETLPAQRYLDISRE